MNTVNKHLLIGAIMRDVEEEDDEDENDEVKSDDDVFVDVFVCDCGIIYFL